MKPRGERKRALLEFDDEGWVGAPMIEAAIPTQIRWLDVIERALSELRLHVQETANLDEASAIAQELRAELSALRPRIDEVNELWRSLSARVTFYPGS
jgi:hypothetical protein